MSEKFMVHLMRLKSSVQRYISLILAIVLVVTNCQVPAFASDTTYAEYLDGWYVQAAWSTLSTSYTWNAETSQMRQPKIVVTYRMKNAEKDYPAGALTFTVPGIGNANRSGVVKASQLAADQADSEWNYVWNKENDTYTFTNKFEVKAGQSVSGGFELMWEFQARDCENGFSQEKSPTFSVQDTGSITMEPLSYNFTSVRDKYRIAWSNFRTLTGEEYDEADKDYIWYYFGTRFDSDYLARGLYKSNYFMSVELPDGASDDDVIAKYNGKTIELTRNKDGKLGFYPFKEKHGDVSSSNYTHYEYVYFGFKKDVLNGQNVTVRGHMDRLYQDESDWTKKADDHECVDVDKTFTVTGYEFNHQGYIYNHHKYNTKYERLGGKYYWNIDDHSEPDTYSDRMQATGLFNGKVVEFTLYGLARRDYGSASAAAASLASDDGIAVASLDDEFEVASLSNIDASISLTDLKAVDEEDDEVIVSDWDDLNWKENGLYEAEFLDGPTYAEMHPNSLSVEEAASIHASNDEEETTASNVVKKVAEKISEALNVSKKNTETESGTSGESSSLETEAETEKNIEKDEEKASSEAETENAKDTSETEAQKKKEDESEPEVKETTEETSKDTTADTTETNDATDAKDEKEDDAANSEENAAHESKNILSSIVSRVSALFSMEAQAAETEGVTTPSNISNTAENNIMVTDLSGETSGKTTKPNGNASGISAIAKDQEYSLVLGDDKLGVLLNSGKMRALEDDEYDITYVTVQGTSKAYDYEVYGTDEQDTHFDQFVLLGTGNTGSTSTVTLPDGVKNVFIRVNGVVGTYSYYAKVGVRFHLDWNAEKEKKDEADQVNRDGKVANFSYLRALYTDDDGYEVNDVGMNKSNYEEDYGEELADRDIDIYKEYLLRDYSNVWLRNPVTKLTATANIKDTAGTGKTGYTATLYGSGTLQGDNSGSLESFSLYLEVPTGMSIDLDELGATVEGNGILLGDGSTTTDFQNHVTLSERDNNGRHYVVADFDFSDDPLDVAEKTEIKLYVPATLSYADYISNGNLYRTNVYVMPHDDGLDKISGEYIKSDEYDIDENSSKTDLMAYASDSETILDTATEWREFVSKYIKSAYSNGYVTDTVTRLYSEDDTSDMKAKSDYSYRLDFGLGSSNAKNIIFFDHIEQGATLSVAGDTDDTTKTVDSAWQGTLVSVDTSQAEKLGMVPTVYYSTSASQKFDLTTSGWTTTAPSDMSTVKSIAISLDTSNMTDGVMKTKQMTYVILNMRAPSDRTLIDKKAVNQYDVQYDAYGLTNKFEDTYVLPSSETYIKLLDNVGKIVLQKVDADNVLKTNEDGTKTYAGLTGAKIQVYDSNGTAIFEDGGKEVNTLGRIVINNVRQGAYYWEETEAPKGYEKITGRHQFEIDGVTSTLNIENKRLPGSVTLTKKDGDDSSYTALSGAEFNLYKSDGTKVFTDSNYQYTKDADGNPTGTNGTFVTGTDNTFTVTSLPWGSYYFEETKAPTGYEVSSSKVSFTIGKNAYDEASDKVHVDVTANDSESTASIELKKTDAENGNAVKGAKFSLYKVGTTEAIRTGLTTNAAGEIFVEGLKFGEYYFVETASAPGYVLPANVDDRKTDSVTLDPSTVGEILKLSMTNDRKTGSVILTKKDDEGYYVSGAVYKLFYKSEKADDYTELTETYTTDSEGEIKVSGLNWGDYYFLEYKAPKGYEVSTEHVEFTINLKTCQSDVLIDTVDNRAKGTVKLIKVDKDEKTKTLPGATYELYKSDGTKCVLGTDYKVSDNGTSITTGDDGTVTIKDLTQGAYYLKETVAPTSYTLSDELIRFSVTKDNAATVQELTAEDEAGKAVLKINKRINESYKPFGDPTFIFKVESSDGKTYEKSITLSDSETSGSVTLSVKKGCTYKVTEISTSRYNLSNVEGITNVTVNGEEATADLITNDNAEVTFTNEIKQYEKFSHVTNATNIVKSATQFTALTLEYTWNKTITQTDVEKDDDGKVVAGYDEENEVFIIPKDKLIVTAFYDDGTSKVIDAEDYTLLKDTFNGNENGAQNLEVTYTENGTTRKASYPVTIKLPIPVKHTVTFDLQGGTITLKNTDGSTSDVTENQNGGKYKEDTSVSLPSNFSGDPIKKGYTFLGWVTKEGITTDTAYNALTDSEKWFRTTSSGTISTKTTKPTMGDKDVTYYAAWTLAFDVKYAVSIYGIEQDEYEGGGSDKAGLTFGPATGASYVSSYKSHKPSETNTTSGNAHRCVHDDDWETIIAWSKKDPYVYEECIAEGCTHSVMLNLSTKLKGTSYKSMTGDGAGCLYNSIQSNYRKWNNVSSNSGGWPASRIRATLNGKSTTDSYLDTSVAGTDYIENADDALIGAFPEELQAAIVAKAVKSDTVYNDTSGNNVTTYDKLWLFSLMETFYGSTYRKNEAAVSGESYQRQKSMNITTSNYSGNISYDESASKNWRWLRSASRSYSYYVCGVNGDGGWRGYYADSTGVALAPGFSIK